MLVRSIKGLKSEPAVQLTGAPAPPGMVLVMGLWPAGASDWRNWGC